MGWAYSIEGYLSAPGAERQYDPPETTAGQFGVLAHGWDEKDPENDIWFWVYDPEYFDSLEDAHYLIEVQFEEYGLPYG